MGILDQRPAALAGGVVLLGVAVGTSALLHDSAVGAVVALSGCTLILFAFLWDRLEKVGPSGVVLRRAKEAAERIARAEVSEAVGPISESVTGEITRGGTVEVHPEPATGSGAGFDPTVARLVDEIRDATTPEQLVSLVFEAGRRSAPRPSETTAERMNRVRKDDAARARMERYGGRPRQ